jgi:DNA-directed RNA polymerase subunit RPC12/RpoP
MIAGDDAVAADYSEPCATCGRLVENAGALIPDGYEQPRCEECL